MRIIPRCEIRRMSNRTKNDFLDKIFPSTCLLRFLLLEQVDFVVDTEKTNRELKKTKDVELKLEYLRLGIISVCSSIQQARIK